LLLATGNAGKVREIRAILGVAGWEIVTPAEAGVAVPPVVEGARSYAENAIAKATAAARAAGLPALADDSGIEVDALGGGPGVRTRRYAGPDATDASNNAKLLAALEGLPPGRRGARYVCVLALALPEARGPRGGLQPILRRGTCRGRIAMSARGEAGFGYDPIFEPAAEPPGGRTLGLYRIDEKHAISHRAQAARRMVPVLRDLGF
jgi:XTP/dITP diphosphohydrolase